MTENLNNTPNKLANSAKQIRRGEGQDGTAIVIALLIMLLLMGFVALAVSRTSNETVASSNDASETRTFEAAQASLEVMTHNFDKIFDVKLSPSQDDLNRIKGQEPDGQYGFTNEYEFVQDIKKSGDSEVVVMTGSQFQGLNALRDEWEIDSTATNKFNGVQVRLKRKFFNNRIPIFQFGIFYEDDLEFHPGPKFDFGGRVHSNRHIFMKAGNQLNFSSKVTATGEVFTDVMKNGSATGDYGTKIQIKNAAGTWVPLQYGMGSVLRDVVNGAPKISEPDMPIAYVNKDWPSNEALFQGNLLAQQDRLDLPLKIASGINGAPLDYIELIKRGLAVGDVYNNGLGTKASPTIVPVTPVIADAQVTSKERFSNKRGIRVSLADSKAKLPGCATGVGIGAVTTECGVRLDGDISGDGSNPSSGSARGYKPPAMADGYQATRINGERFRRGSSVETWIKIEAVGLDPLTDAIETVDITQDVLSLGVTEQAVTINDGLDQFSIDGYGNADSRSVVKLQRFYFGNVKVESTDTSFVSMSNWNSRDFNYVVAARRNETGGVPDLMDPQDPVDNGPCNDLPTSDINYYCYSKDGEYYGDHEDHWKLATVGATNAKAYVVPFPIKMFDTREGLYNDSIDTTSKYGDEVTWAGTMTMIDLDIANLKKFLEGDFDAMMPTGTPFHVLKGRSLKATDIPESNGWVVYVSDRRGDYDFDGEYDMEDVYGPTDGILQYGEDLNNNGTLETDFANEAVRYTGSGTTLAKGVAATLETPYYRRGVRLINGRKLPGAYDVTVPENTRGFTVASENGVYTLGNYNAIGIGSYGNPTESTEYLPQDTSDHVPASVVGDTVSILSNSWNDGNSFKNAFNLSSRLASDTQVRFAMMSGDTRTSLKEPGEPDQGGSDKQLGGGVHNFKRFLEKWSKKRLNYAGSLINLYNSRNNNAPFKCCRKVYSPPIRDWVFDATFLDPNRLPPGTPYFQTIQLTGFQRLN